MRQLRLLLLGVGAACLVALATAFAGGGSRAATAPPTLPKPPRATAPTLHAATSVDTITTSQRSFVSTSGSDTNDCTATSPCRSFGTAITHTNPGGEVVALTSGGYGPVGIGMSVTLIGAPGVHAAITASSGDAIDVEAGATDTVVLRNLYLNGLGSGTAGIFYASGQSLQLEQITATGFTFGVDHVDPGGRLYATDTVLRDNVDGILVDPASGTAPVSLDRVRAEDNTGDAIFGLQNAQLRISDCIASGNHDGIAAEVATMISGCQISDNSSGGVVVAGATAQIGGSTITHNGVGLDNVDGTLQSFGDNLVAANTTDTSGTISTIGKT